MHLPQWTGPNVRDPVPDWSVYPGRPLLSRAGSTGFCRLDAGSGVRGWRADVMVFVERVWIAESLTVFIARDSVRGETR